jgi:hypothetical protein
MGKIVLVKKHFLCGFLVCGISVVEISYIMLEVVGCGSEFFSLQMCKKLFGLKPIKSCNILHSIQTQVKTHLKFGEPRFMVK